MRMLELHIEVEDLERSLEFYTRLLPHNRRVTWTDGSAVALVLPDGTSFGIWKRGKRGMFNGQAAEHLHYAFQIEPDQYSSFRARLSDMGVELSEHTWPNGHRSLYFFDPDGHQGELITCDWLALGRSDGQ